MIVAESSGEAVAMIVDKVIGVSKLAALEAAQSNQRLRIDPRFALGVATVDDRPLFVLDMARVIVIPPPLPKAA